MEAMDIKFLVQVMIYIVTLGSFYGKLTTELKYMKEKLDKHNSFQDRLVMVEQSTSSAHYRLDEHRKRIDRFDDKFDELRE